MKISFFSNRPWLNLSSPSLPKPAIKLLPEWYLKADRYLLDKDRNNVLDESGNKIPNWKACPAIYDIMGTGYFLRTPSDITFYEDKDKRLKFKIHKRYEDFIQYRSEIPSFMHPEGFRRDHFAWWPDWSIVVPEGYSVLYSQPFNRFELPFMNTNGIIDNDKVNLPGTIPFFIRNGWTGTIKAGTPYMQILPFKREDWSSESLLLEEEDIYNKNIENSNKYRVSGGSVYLNQVWERRKYE